jgi:TolB-like protein
MNIEESERTMKTPTIIAAAVLGVASLARGQATTMPVVETPAVQAASTEGPSTAAPAQGPWKVLIEPFKLLGNTAGHEWVSEAIQENLSATVSSNNGMWTIDGSAPAGRDGAMAEARSAGAVLVIFGSCEISDGQIRAIGQVDDVQTGLTLGTLKATGNSSDLFRVEDDLTNQLGTELPQAPGAAQAQAQAQPQVTEAPAQVAPPAQQYVYPAQPYSYNYGYTPDYSYPDYGYGGYAYPYYYGYPGVAFYGGFGYGRFGYGGYRGGGFRGGFGGGFHGGGFGGGGHGGGGHGR